MAGSHVSVCMCDHCQIPDQRYRTVTARVKRIAPAKRVRRAVRRTPFANLRVGGGAVKVSFEKALEEWEKQMEKDFEANRAAERLGAEDFAIRVNAKA